MTNTNNYQKLVDFLELLKEVKETSDLEFLKTKIPQLVEMRKQFKEFVFKRENHTNKDRIFAIDGVPLVILLTDDLSSLSGTVKLMSRAEALDWALNNSGQILKLGNEPAEEEPAETIN